ncbi:DUF2834 domain-containing protein [Phormidium yuhuli AB48]|uniref:DUF2834 domain-containing protein n=1 Tax=Phormidium yuhuli AB48 TaxID=2940671 RepID=A0ABY5AKN8_9CYAN|nr:DUF2834 domain-containing protein [Phormidium yuhuli]USR89687.1 DUF2834 domain-containing protein [Phormidium yuhuli AB48]
MTRRLFFIGLWFAFLGYAFLLAPPDRPETVDLIINLSSGNWDGLNPAIVALFNLMGIFPFAYGAMMFADGRGQKIGAWVFAAASFGVGAFAILPYLALRDPNPNLEGDLNPLLRFWDSRILGGILTLGAIALLGFGLSQGNWSDFSQQWQSSRFIHVMSLDFCLLCGLVPALLGDDMARRGLKNPKLFWAVSLTPLLGLLLYLSLRPPLEAATPALQDSPQSS